MKRRKDSVVVGLYGSLDTETPEEMMGKGAFQTLTNFYPKNNVMKKRGVLSAISTPIASGNYTGLHGLNFQGNNTLFRMYNDSGNKIDKWTGGAWSSITTGLTHSDILRWSVSHYYYDDTEVAILTNNNDDIGIYDNASYIELGTVSSSAQRPVKAKFVIELEGYLLTFNIVQADGGTRYNNRIRWCNIFDLTTWSNDDWQDILGSGEILGVVRFNTEVYVFTKNSITRISGTGDTTAPFSFTYHIVPFGSKWSQSIIDCKNKIVFPSSDYGVRAFDGFKSVLLSDKVDSLFNSSPELSSAAFDGDESQYVLQVGSDILAVDLGNPSSTEIDFVNFAKETYAGGAVSFLTTLAETPYGVQGNNVVQLHIDGTQDLGVTPVSSELETGKFVLGNRLEAKLGKIRIYGKELSGSGTTTITTTLYPTGSTIVSAINLSPNGTDIQINQWVKQLKFNITNSASQRINIYKIVIEVLNTRKY